MLWFSESILDYKVCKLGCKATVIDIINSMVQPKGKSCRWMACLNPHSYTVSTNDITFSSALKNADWLVPDGVGVILASKILGGSIRERVTGSDVFFGLSEALNHRDEHTVFFLGSTESTLSEIKARFERDYPKIRIVGMMSPPFKPAYSCEEIDLMISTINSVSPDVLWVGMTAPKQEKWIYENRDRLNVKFAGAIGAVFDFYAGKIKRSHPIFQSLGLEWLPRFLQEPRRLWRRTFISAPIFLWHILLAKFNFKTF